MEYLLSFILIFVLTILQTNFENYSVRVIDIEEIEDTLLKR